MTRLYLLATVALALLYPSTQATTGCKNCVILGKEQKAMFRMHSAACAESSGVSARSVEALVGGGDLRDLQGHEHDEERERELQALRKHVYCVLLKCKLITKDGKLQKSALRGKMPARADGKNVTKVLESCAEQGGDSPEEIAWNIFRCGYDKKALLFNYMPVGVQPPSSGVVDDNS